MDFIFSQCNSDAFSIALQRRLIFRPVVLVVVAAAAADAAVIIVFWRFSVEQGVRETDRAL